MSIVIGNKTVAGIHIANKEVQRITIGGKVAYEKGPKYLTIENEYAGSNTISLEAHGTLDLISLDYSTDNGSTWTTWNSANGNLSVTLAQGGKVMFKGDNNYFSKDDNNTYRFHATANCNASGNIMSLVDSTCTSLVIPSSNCFNKLFRGNTYVDINGLELPATTLTEGCYRAMFASTSITVAPELPATNLEISCYQNMFQSTSITVAPALPATTLADSCYRLMLAYTLISESPVLPATTLTTDCYLEMFLNCSNLNKVTTYANDISASRCIQNWLSNVAATGDFYNLGGATIPSGASGIPSGWTEHTTL